MHKITYDWIATKRGCLTADGEQLWAVVEGHEIDGDVLAEGLSEDRARMMAAAPFLVADALDVLDLVESEGRDTGDGDAFSNLRDSIAKALGND